MPDPGVSDRERLLRLIDGGPDVVKEVQQQREASTEKKPVPVVPVVKSGLNVSAVIKMALAMILLLFAIHSFTELVRSMGKTENAVTSSASGEPGVGLRLVGVDWSDAPVALLEDLKTGKTYFAKKNDRIKGTRIQQIFKDKVLVSFHGKTAELR